MIRAGTGFSDESSVEKAILDAGAQALERGGFTQADLLLAFANWREPGRWISLVKKLKSLAGTGTVVGCSAYGVLTELTEIEERPGVAVMAVAGLEDHFLPFILPNLQENNYRAGFALAESLEEAGIDSPLTFLFPDAFSFQHGPFFDGFESRRGFLSLVGGLASEDEGKQKTWQWLGDQISFDAISGVAFGGNLEFEMGITQSCQPLGEPVQVTRAQGNVIFEIEGRPAYDIFLELITQFHFEDSSEVFHRLFLGLPLTSFQTDFTRSRYLVRNIMGVNAKQGVLACASQVEEGDFVTFALRDSRKAKEDLVLTLEDLQERADGRKPAFGFYFNCCARGTSLHGTPGEDTALIREYFPSLPVTGFFSFGEIAPVESVNHLHHYSGVLALAFEK